MAKQDHTLTSSGFRPASSAARFTVSTARTVVSSVKKVCRTTASKTLPPKARELGPNAVKVNGMYSSNPESSRSTGQLPAGPLCPTMVSPRCSRRIIPTKSSISAVLIRGNPKASNIISIPLPRPREKRPPVRKCIVDAYAPVTTGWRVL